MTGSASHQMLFPAQESYLAMYAQMSTPGILCTSAVTKNKQTALQEGISPTTKSVHSNCVLEILSIVARNVVETRYTSHFRGCNLECLCLFALMRVPPNN